MTRQSNLIYFVPPFVIGMIIANECSAWLNLWVLVAVLVVLVVGMVLLFRRSGVFTVLAMMAVCCIGAGLFLREYRVVEERRMSGVRAELLGTLCELPVEKQRSVALEVEMENGSRVIVYVGRDKSNPQCDSMRFAALNIGDTILAKLQFVTPTVDGDYYQRYLFFNGVSSTAYTPLGQWRHLPRSDGKTSYHAQLRKLQECIHRVYAEHDIVGDDGAIIEAMTIGRRSEIASDTKREYADAGVSHILALSGYHVGFVLAILQFLFFSRVVPFKYMWISELLIIIALCCFTLIAGSSPSLVRATVMCIILLVCKGRGETLFSLNSLAIALFVMLCYNPFLLFNAGFQLSFVAVLGIALFGNKLDSLCPVRNFFVRLVWANVSISFICVIFTMPISAYHFGKIAPLSVISTLAISLFVCIIMYVTVLWWATLWWSALNGFLTAALMTAANTMNRIVESIASLPFSTVEFHPSVVGVILCYLLIAACCVLFRLLGRQS